MNRLERFLERQIAFPDAYIPDRPADVVIGIGTDVSADGKDCSPQSAAIADHVLLLFRAGCANNVLLVGGNHAKHGNLVEAMAMANRIGHKLPEGCLYLECCSRNTRENAMLSLEIMKEHGWRYAIIVAQPVHALRVSRTFRKLWIAFTDCLTHVHCRTVTAPSEYGGGSQWRWRNFLSFFIWDRLIAMPLFKLKGWI